MEKILVIGLGNPYLTDDGVGVKVAYEVKKSFRSEIPENITITEASIGGIRLMEMLIGFDKVILIDAILSKKIDDIGKITHMSLDDLRNISPTQHSYSAHDTSLATAIDAGREMGFHLPDDISIYAIGVENIIDFNENPTPAVAAVISQVTEAVLQELNRHINHPES